jgi:hypothetical protein
MNNVHKRRHTMFKRIASALTALTLIATPVLAGPSTQHSAQATYHSGQAVSEAGSAVASGAAAAVSAPVKIVGATVAITGAGLLSAGAGMMQAGDEIYPAYPDTDETKVRVLPNGRPSLD